MSEERFFSVFFFLILCHFNISKVSHVGPTMPYLPQIMCICVICESAKYFNQSRVKQSSLLTVLKLKKCAFFKEMKAVQSPCRGRM